MEDAVLENSKGATYMSFILDVEIVLKREEARANVAQSKARSENETPKSTGEIVKEYIEDSSKSNTSRNANEAQVYTATQESTDVFKEQNTPPKENESSLVMGTGITRKENIIRELNTNHDKATDNNIYDINIDFSHNEHCTLDEGYREKNETIKSPNDAHVHYNPYSLNQKRTSKTIKTKIEKKSKGKVEGIDFVERNRIFMCNYLKIPDHDFYSYTLRPYSTNVVLPPIDQKLAIKSNHNRKIIYLRHLKFPFINGKFSWKKIKTKLNLFQLFSQNDRKRYSTKECDDKGSVDVPGTCFKNDFKDKRSSDECVKFSSNLSTPRFHKCPQRQCQNTPESSFSVENNLLDKQRHISRCHCSYEHLFLEAQRNLAPEYTEINKSYSLPNIDQVKLIESAECRRKCSTETPSGKDVIEDVSLQGCQEDHAQQFIHRTLKCFSFVGSVSDNTEVGLLGIPQMTLNHSKIQLLFGATEAKSKKNKSLTLISGKTDVEEREIKPLHTADIETDQDQFSELLGPQEVVDDRPTREEDVEKREIKPLNTADIETDQDQFSELLGHQEVVDDRPISEEDVEREIKSLNIDDIETDQDQFSELLGPQEVVDDRPTHEKDSENTKQPRKMGAFKKYRTFFRKILRH